MEPKRLTCMGEDLTIEISKSRDQDRDTIITVSITRTYLFTDPQEMIGHNGDRKLTHPDIHVPDSVAI